MVVVLQPWQILVAALAGWISRQQDAVIEYRPRRTGLCACAPCRVPLASRFAEQQIFAILKEAETGSVGSEAHGRGTGDNCLLTVRSGDVTDFNVDINNLPSPVYFIEFESVPNIWMLLPKFGLTRCGHNVEMLN